MPKELSLIIKKIKDWIKKEKVIDVILFGSVIRGRIKPSDIDLCILVKDKEEKRSLDLIDSLGRLLDENNFKIHINILTDNNFISGNTLAKTLLTEGFSIKNGKNFSKIFGLENKSIFVYSLKEFSSSKRVKFHYVLRGRYGNKGVLEEINGRFLGSGSIILPTTGEDCLKEVFGMWNVKYRVFRTLIS